MFINHKVTGGRLSAYSYCILILIYSDTFVSSDVSEPTTLSSEADSRQSYCSRDASIDACPVTNKYKTEEEDKLNVGSIEDKPGKMTSLAVVPYDETNLPLHKMSVRHFSIAGNNFTIHQNFLGLGVSAFVWDSAVVLAKYLAKNRHLVHGKKVIELGAGTGLTGLVAAALGADVTVTERAEVISHLNSSINLNTQGKSWKISAQVLDWTEKLSLQNFLDVDVILGSDIIYVERTFQDLLMTFKTLAPNNKVHILLSCRIRYDRDVHFLDMLKEDFDVNEIFVDKEKKIQVFSVWRHL